METTNLLWELRYFTCGIKLNLHGMINGSCCGISFIGVHVIFFVNFFLFCFTISKLTINFTTSQKRIFNMVHNKAKQQNTSHLTYTTTTTTTTFLAATTIAQCSSCSSPVRIRLASCLGTT
jgi:hypothetical protein